MSNPRPAELAIRRFYCVNCGARAGEGGMCGACPDEPLLNLAQEGTWVYFDEEHGRAKVRRYGQAVAVCLPVGVLLMGGLSLLGFGFIVSIPAAAGATAGLASFGVKLFPPKRLGPVLTDHELAALRSH